MGRMQLRSRRGQAELLGGLIILTILLVIVLPLLINSYTDATRLAEQARSVENRIDLKLKERLTIQGVRQEVVGPDLWPGVWINNTGTVQVSLRTLYLINIETGEIIAALDMTRARPATSTMIDAMYLNPDPAFVTSDPLPPVGEPIVLKPGDHLFIVFNDAHPALANLDKLIIRILSAEGVLHPQGGGGDGQGQLVPPPVVADIELEPWKGAFNPYAGFKLIGGSQLFDTGDVKVIRPSIIVTSDILEDGYIDTSTSFIYDDPDYPGLYMLYLEISTSWWEVEEIVPGSCNAFDGDTVVIKGFIGTYYTYEAGGGQRTYFFGYAMEVWINGWLCQIGSMIEVNPSSSTAITDFDANGVDEATFFSYLNGPNYTPSDTDADGRDYGFMGSDEDAAIWVYTVRRDISGMDFVRITGKVNYYWTTTYIGQYNVYRDLRIFSVAIWEYDQATDTWRLRHFKDFTYSEVKPRQFQFTAVFPLDRTKTYRVGLLFYDSYLGNFNPDTGDWGHKDFTYSLEYLVVEYGRNNPLFSTTPPVYIVAIPDPNKINNIGEVEYSIVNGVDVLTAEVMAQAELLSLVKASLENAGLTDYVVITTTSELCNILFNNPDSGLPGAPPERAVVIWLQGDADISTVSDGCASDVDLRNYIETYNWVFAQVSGNPLWGSLSVYTGTGSAIQVYTGVELMNLTDAGINARILYKAFRMPLEAEFIYTLSVLDPDCMAVNATFYHNVTYTPDRYGTLGFWAGCNPDPLTSGILVVNPVDIDWAQDGGGVIPEAVAQMVTYAALEAYRYLAP